jgi:hypothetical protein
MVLGVPESARIAVVVHGFRDKAIDVDPSDVIQVGLVGIPESVVLSGGRGRKIVTGAGCARN